MNADEKIPRPVSFEASDGYALQGFVWQRAGGDAGGRMVIVVNAATSVKCEYYARFARYLHGNGFDVLTYDYRGIGASKPASLRRFDAGWIDWGRLDFEAALRYVAQAFPGQPVGVVGHSVGGFLIGLAASSQCIDRVFTVGAQFAYWRDYVRHKRARMVLKWHVFMPMLTALLGYFPGNRLGWLEDTPRGVVRDWTARTPRFEDAWRRKPLSLPDPEIRELLAGFAAMRGDMLAVSLSDDEFGTLPAIRRLLDYFGNARRTHLHLTPESAGEKNIGHFAFFHERFKPTLWPLALEWFRQGRVTPPMGSSVAVFPPGQRIEME